MTTTPIVTTFNTLAPIIIQEYERYLPTAFDSNLTMLQKVNAIIQSLSTTNDTVNSLIGQWNDQIVPYVNGDGFQTDVNNKLDTMASDGTLASLISTDILGDLSTLITSDKSTIVGAINSNATRINDMYADVTQFGAKGDGVTDDTTAIQNAIRSGQRVYFPPNKTYVISSTLLVDNTFPTELFGGGTIKANGDFDYMRLKNINHYVHHLIFDGTNRTVGNGIIVEGTSQYSIIEKNTFTNIASCGVQIQSGAIFTTVKDNTFNGCGWGSNVPQPFDNTIYIADADDVKILSNSIINSNAGIYFRGTTAINNYICEGNRISCKDNTVAGLQGISNAYGNNGRIIGNYIYNFNDNGIDTNGCQFMTIANNVISACKDGVFVGDNASKNISIIGNVMRGVQRGVRVYNTTANNSVLIKNVIIEGNTIEANTSEGVLASCTGTGSLMSHIHIKNNTIDLVSTGTVGVSLNNIGQSFVSGNNIVNCLNEGIKSILTDMVQILDNTIQDVSKATSNTYDMVNLDSQTNRTIIDNLICYGSGRYAVNTAGSVGTLKTVKWRSMTTGGVNNTGTNNSVGTDCVAF